MRTLVLVVIVFILGMFALAMLVAPDWTNTSSLPANRSYGTAMIGGAFAATDHNGQPFTEKNLQGHYSLIYFGFTHCPDICPASLLVVAGALEHLPEKMAAQILPVFVSVDPERDTPEVMRNYVQNFYPRMIGVTGSKEQIDSIAKAYKVYYNKVPVEGSASEYAVDHSGFLYLMGINGEYITHFPHNVTEQVLADALRSHIPNS